MRVLVVIILLTALVLPTAAFAEVQTITATHTYVMGDNDSRNDARQLCFLVAKRKVLEQAGSFIQSLSVVENMNLTKDQISSYSAAILGVEIVKEQYGVSNGQTTLSLTVKADVDLADVQKRLAAIVMDRGLQDRIAAQQRQIGQLEQQVQQLNERLNVAPANGSGELRKDRNVVFGNLQELENRKLAAVQRITAKTDLIQKYIVKNMTKEEVIGILGQPQNATHRSLFYGERWICFEEKSWTVIGIGLDDDWTCYHNELGK